jgi:hypothetical protein
MAETMVEKAAAAINHAARTTGGVVTPPREHCLLFARAAIEALREPTPEMVEAGFDKLDYDDTPTGRDADDFNKRVCARVFTAMLDAATSDPSGKD